MFLAQKHTEMVELLKTPDAKKEINALSEYFEKVRKKWLPLLSEKYTLHKNISTDTLDYTNIKTSTTKYDEHAYIVGICLRLPGFIKILGCDIDKKLMYTQDTTNMTMFSDHLKTISPIDFMKIYGTVLISINKATGVFDFTHYNLHPDKILLSKDNNPVITDYTTAHIKITSDILGNTSASSFEYNAHPLKSFPLYDAYKLLCYSLYYMMESKNKIAYDEVKKYLGFFTSESPDNVIKDQKQYLYSLYLPDGDRDNRTLDGFIKYIKEDRVVTLSPKSFEELYQLKFHKVVDMDKVIFSFPYRLAHNNFMKEYTRIVKEYNTLIDGFLIFQIKHYPGSVILGEYVFNRYKGYVIGLYKLISLWKSIVRYNKFYSTVNGLYGLSDDVDTRNFETLLSRVYILSEAKTSLEEDLQYIRSQASSISNDHWYKGEYMNTYVPFILEN